MRQLLLDLGTEPTSTLEDFVAGSNCELLQRLQRLADGDKGLPDERSVYVWGGPGVGKTHLLQAVASMAGGRYLRPESSLRDFMFEPDTALYLIDDCERLSPALQMAAFALFNQAREYGACLLAAGAAAPATLNVREDLRTRLGWGLIYQVHGLSDEEKLDALAYAAQARGITLPTGVLPYLITHCQRDLNSLLSILDALDSYSLEIQRPITLPLLRSLLQRNSETKP